MPQWLKDTISASEIIYLINPNHLTGNSEVAARGKIEHIRVTKDITSGIIPKALRSVVFDQPVESRTKASTLEINNGLWMSVIPDLQTPTKVFELKPQARELRYYALQLAIGCMVKDVNMGILFFYQNENAYRLNNGGQQCWDVIKTMGNQARRILDIQTRIDELKKIPVEHKIKGRNCYAFETTADWGSNKYQEKMRLGFEACDIRRRFDMNTKIVFKNLQSSLQRIN